MSDSIAPLRPEDVRDPEPGDMLGAYRVEETLGRGGMGQVFRGVHETDGTPVAIKVVLRQYAEHPTVLRRIIHEARAVAAVRHPNVVDILELGQLPDGRPYIVMPLLPGDSLDHLLQQRGRLSAREAVAVLAPAMTGLDAAHACKVVHRDLKPGNLLLDVDSQPWQVTLIDFGLALQTESTETRLTEPGLAMGTPAFMAPEQFYGDENQGDRVDIYAMGLVAWTMLAGKPPFEGNAAELMYRHLNVPAPKLPADVIGVPERLEELIARMLEKSPDKRPSATEVRAELGHVFEPGPTRQVPRKTSERGPIVGALSVLAVLGIAAGTWLGLKQDPPPGGPPPALSIAPPQAKPIEPEPPNPPPPPNPSVPVPAPAPPETAAAPKAAQPAREWPCRELIRVSDVRKALSTQVRGFDMAFETESRVVVVSKLSKSDIRAHLKLHHQLEQCKGTKATVRVQHVVNNGIWTGENTMWVGGIRVEADDISIVNP